jgi:hypothetical protein
MQIACCRCSRGSASVVEVKREDFEEHDRIIQLGVSPNRIDLLTSISGVTFDQAWSTRENAELDGIAVPFIGLAALIQNKQHTGRARDLRDARAAETFQPSQVMRQPATEQEKRLEVIQPFSLGYPP